MANFGDIGSGIALTGGQSVRRNAGDTAFEAFTPGSGGTGDVSKVGTPVNNQVGVWTGDGTLEGDVDLTFDTTTNTLGVGLVGLDARVQVHAVKSDASDGLLIEASNGTDVGLLGVGNTANATWYGSHNYDTATQDTIAAFTGAGKTLGSLATASYPSLTELSYVKGVTSALQTQLNDKAPLVSPSFTTPSLGVATATSINGATITSGTLNGSVTGTNTGDQTSIVGISGTIAQFNTACSDADFATLAGNTFTGTQTLPAVSTTVAPLKFTTGGTLLTTAEDGAIEMDDNCFYGTTDEGNRGIIPIEHFIRADATRTFTGGITTQQAIFTTPANGTLTLETGTYIFEGLIAMDTMSGTSGNGKFSIIGAGTATLAAILWQAYGGDVAAEGTAAAIGGSWHVIATQTAVNVVTAGAGTALCFLVKGTFEVSVAGTIIPSFAQTTAAAAVLNIGSYFKCSRVGSTSVTSVGQWT